MHSVTTTTTTLVILITSFLIPLISTQETSVYTGQPEQFAPTFTLNPTDSAIISKYTSDLSPHLLALVTAPPFQTIIAFYATDPPTPPNSPADGPAFQALKGDPVPTSAAEITILPSALQADLVGAYETIAAIASQDLSQAPGLKSIAPDLLMAPPGGAAPVETVVTGANSTGNGSASGTGLVPSTSGSGAAAASASASALKSGTAAASGTRVGTGISSSATGTGSPIASANPGSGAERVSAGLGAIALVAIGVVAIL